MYVCISVPYQAGFDLEIATWTFVWFIELLIDVYFVVDIMLNFRTPYYDTTGRLVYSGRVRSHRHCLAPSLLTPSLPEVALRETGTASKLE